MTHYVYLWADGIHCGVRGDDERMCVLVILGVDDRGEKQLVSLSDGYLESEESWLEMLLRHEPKLAIADGTLGL